MLNKFVFVPSVLMLGLVLLAVMFGWVGLVSVLVAFTAVALAFYFLEYKPEIYLLVMIFFFYRGFYIIDTEVLFRLPGVFKAKDILLACWLGYWVFRELLRQPPKMKEEYSAFIKNPLCLNFKILGGLGVVVLAYTILYLKESPLLAIRSARDFLSYFWPLLAFRLMTRDQFERFFKCLVGLVLIGVVFSLVRGGVRGVEEYGSATRYGVVRFQNVVESLAYTTLIFFVVSWLLNPRRKYFFLAALFSLSILAFTYRARIAGMSLGILLTIFYLHGRERGRLLLLLALAPAGLLLMLGLYGVLNGVGFAEYIKNFFDFFTASLDADLGGSTFRRIQLVDRLPLIEKYPIFGIGFLGPYGKVTWDLYYQGYMPLGFVDAGWADLMLRYGFIGMPIIFFFYLFSMYLAIKRYRQCRGGVARAANLSIFVFVILSFCTLYSFNYMGFEAVYITFVLLNMFAFFESLKDRDRELVASAS